MIPLFKLVAMVLAPVEKKTSTDEVYLLVLKGSHFKRTIRPFAKTTKT